MDDTASKIAAHTKMVFLLLLYRCHFNISTVSGQWPNVTPNTCVHYVWKLTQSFSDAIFLSLEPLRPTLQHCPDYIFSLDQTLVFTHFPTASFLLASSSLSLLFLKLPSRAREAILSCVTYIPTWMAHWLQLDHTKLQQCEKQPQWLILHNHISLLQYLNCIKAPDVI